jgi:hypothetical protein
MKEEYLIKNSIICPVCGGIIIHIHPYFSCNDCQSTFKYVKDDENGRGVMARKLNPKEDGEEHNGKN